MRVANTGPAKLGSPRPPQKAKHMDAPQADSEENVDAFIGREASIPAIFWAHDKAGKQWAATKFGSDWESKSDDCKTLARVLSFKPAARGRPDSFTIIFPSEDGKLTQSENEIMLVPQVREYFLVPCIVPGPQVPELEKAFLDPSGITAVHIENLVDSLCVGPTLSPFAIIGKLALTSLTFDLMSSGTQKSDFLAKTEAKALEIIASRWGTARSSKDGRSKILEFEGGEDSEQILLSPRTRKSSSCAL